MLKKFNTEFTSLHELAKKFPDKTYRELEDLKLTSAQARARRPTSHKLRAQASSRSPQAPRFGSQGTGEQAQGPGHKQRG